MKILIYGYGNPGRRDDGLGAQFCEAIDAWITANNITGITTDTNYQLNIEDADNITDYDVVIFVDASIEDIDDFIITKVVGDPKVDFSMHSVSADFVVNLSHALTDNPPQVYLVHLKGYEWDLCEELTKAARDNMNAALATLQPILAEATNTDQLIAKLDKLV